MFYFQVKSISMEGIKAKYFFVVFITCLHTCYSELPTATCKEKSNSLQYTSIQKISWEPFRICLLNLSFLSFKVGKNRNDVYNLPSLSKQIFMDTPLECFMTVNHLVLLYSQTFTKINLHALSKGQLISE